MWKMDFNSFSLILFSYCKEVYLGYYCVIRLPYRGALASLRDGSVPASWSPAPGLGQLQVQIQAGQRIDIKNLEKTWEWWLVRSSTWVGNVHLHDRNPTESWVASKEVWKTGQGRWFSPFTPCYSVWSNYTPEIW